MIHNGLKKVRYESSTFVEIRENHPHKFKFLIKDWRLDVLTKTFKIVKSKIRKFEYFIIESKLLTDFQSPY